MGNSRQRAQARSPSPHRPGLVFDCEADRIRATVTLERNYGEDHPEEKEERGQ
jgi:hypothetical protein